MIWQLPVWEADLLPCPSVRSNQPGSPVSGPVITARGRTVPTKGSKTYLGRFSAGLALCCAPLHDQRLIRPLSCTLPQSIQGKGGGGIKTKTPCQFFLTRNIKLATALILTREAIGIKARLAQKVQEIHVGLLDMLSQCKESCINLSPTHLILMHLLRAKF